MERDSRVILNNDEREILELINKLKIELRFEKESTGKMNTGRLMNLMNLKDMLLASILKRS